MCYPVRDWWYLVLLPQSSVELFPVTVGDALPPPNSKESIWIQVFVLPWFLKYTCSISMNLRMYSQVSSAWRLILSGRYLVWSVPASTSLSPLILHVVRVNAKMKTLYNANKQNIHTRMKHCQTKNSDSHPLHTVDILSYWSADSIKSRLSRILLMILYIPAYSRLSRDEWVTNQWAQGHPDPESQPHPIERKISF